MDPQSLVHDFNDDLWPNLQIFVKKNFHTNYILQDRPFFQWQYEKNPDNRSGVASFKILLAKDKLLGFLGMIPQPVKVFDKVYNKGGALCNLMIDESCRALGLGLFLMRSVTDEYDVLWGTGFNPRTGPMYEKMGGWKLMGNFNHYVKVLSEKKVGDVVGEKFVVSKRTQASRSGNIVVRNYGRFGNDADRFWDEVSSRYPITVVRSSKYLNWRYNEHPFFDYKILHALDGDELRGYIVYRLEESTGSAITLRVGHILDLIAVKGIERDLIIETEKNLIDAGADLIDYHSTGLFHHNAFIGSGYHHGDEHPYTKIPLYFNPIDIGRGDQVKNKINFLVYLNGVPESEKEKMSDHNNWYLTKGDGDKDRPNPH